MENSKNEENNFSFSAFLVEKGFEKKDYPAAMSTYEFETDIPNTDKKNYFCITIKHLDETYTAASSNRDGLYKENEQLPIDLQVAEELVNDFLK